MIYDKLYLHRHIWFSLPCGFQRNECSIPDILTIFCRLCRFSHFLAFLGIIYLLSKIQLRQFLSFLYVDCYANVQKNLMRRDGEETIQMLSLGSRFTSTTLPSPSLTLFCQIWDLLSIFINILPSNFRVNFYADLHVIFQKRLMRRG